MTKEQAQEILNHYFITLPEPRTWLDHKEVVDMLMGYNFEKTFNSKTFENEMLINVIKKDEKLSIAQIEFLMEHVFGYEEMHNEGDGMLQYHHPYYNVIETISVRDNVTARMLARRYADNEIRIEQMKKKYNL